MGFPKPRELKISRNLFIPKRGSIFDYVYVKKTYGSWHRWANLTKSPDLGDSVKVRERIQIQFHAILEYFMLIFCEAF